MKPDEVAHKAMASCEVTDPNMRSYIFEILLLL